MHSTHSRNIIIFFMIAGLLAACASQPTESPASAPTDQPAPATQALPPTDAATLTLPTTPPTTVSDSSSAVSFANDVLPILQSRCQNCHGGQRTEEDLNLLSFAAVMAGSKNGLVVTPGNADDSPLAESVVSQKMPKRGPKLTPDQVQLIIDWINQGALDN